MWVQSQLPRWRHPQPPPRKAELATMVQNKLAKVRTRRYVQSGAVTSLTSYFAVAKGEDDVRMVYNASSSGLNEALWVPNFGLPTVESVLRAVDSGTWMCDNDVGDMFLNFMLHIEARPYAGIDLSPYFGDELSAQRRVLWERWERCMMGLKSSPYQTIQSFLWAEEIMQGNPSDANNTLRWDEIALNLPGLVGYTSSLPWVSKRVRESQRIASDFFVYVDDVRPTGASRDDCWRTACRVASVGNYLGIQDASRKRRPPSQCPGAWAGSLIQATPAGVGVLVSQERWEKTQRIIQGMQEELLRTGCLEHKPLERARGFLVYIARSYPMMTPYLKGIHLTLDLWRGGRDASGWKHVGVRGWELWEEVEDGGSGVAMAPMRVHGVPRLAGDLQALESLTNMEFPPVRLVRSERVSVVRYGFGDASGAGFGASLFTPASSKMWYRHGVWGSDGAGHSSNYCELGNLVDTLSRFGELHDLSRTELFLFTNNTVAEAAYFNGTSSNEELFLLVLRLRRLEMASGLRLHVIHVAGSWMMSQGTDGLSRGNLTEGVLGGSGMLEFMPLHLGAVERWAGVLDWIRTWCGDVTIEPLTPEDWFRLGHDIVGSTTNQDGMTIPVLGRLGMVHLWAPAPAAAEVAVEELRYARHKRQLSTHIFLCPRLMTYRWRRALHKAADVVVTIGCDWEFWPSTMSEPLILGVCLPFGLDRPWSMRHHPEVVALGVSLQWVVCESVWCGPCYVASPKDDFHINLPEDEEGFVWADRVDEGRFQSGRDGDHLITIFQCDLCVFRVLRLREPDAHCLVDTKLLRFIRRMNLDALWSREPSTVSANARGLRTGLELLSGFGDELNVYPNLGPFPAYDTLGYGVALQMLEYSRHKGRYANHMQYKTVRKLRSGYANVFHASAIGGGEVMSFGGKEKRFVAMTRCPTQLQWFARFLYGCKKRMGQDVCPDLAMSMAVMKEMVEELVEMGKESKENEERQNLIVSVIAYATICYCGSLRGHEGFLVDLRGLRMHLGDGRADVEDPHVVVPLLGRFKNEVGERYHLILLASSSRSGLNPRAWVEALVRVRESEGRLQGPAFCNREGHKEKTSVYNDVISEALLRVQGRRSDLIPVSLNVPEEYGANRSFRRGSTTQAGNQGVSGKDIEVINQWRTVESARGMQPNLQMREHYSEVLQMKRRLLRYSAAL